MASASLLQHYIDYLLSPSVLIATLLVVGPVLYQVYQNRIRLPPETPPSSPREQGCFRLGLSKRSNLDHPNSGPNKKQASAESDSITRNARIKALFTYPIKSCRGVELAASEVLGTGLKYDRLFTFAQLVSKQDNSKTSGSGDVKDVSGDWTHEWRFMTQRDLPRLALLNTELWVPDHRAIQRKKADGITAGNERQLEHAKGRKETEIRPSSPLEHLTEDSWYANGGCLIVRFPFEPDFNPFGLRTETVTLRIPLAPTSPRAEAKRYCYEPLIIWKDCPQAINVTKEIAADDLAKLKYFLGVSNPLGLFRSSESNMRAVTRSLPKDVPGAKYSVGFADAFPLHILSLASVRALDDELPEKAKPMKGKLNARRFRANIYVEGLPAYGEDSWKRINIGRCVTTRDQQDEKSENSRSSAASNGTMLEAEAGYHVACRTARCKLPNVHPNTGIKDANEPYTTLGRMRKVDKGAYPHPCLGMQMIPLFQQGILRVGDEVEVLETGEHCYEKMFA